MDLHEKRLLRAHIGAHLDLSRTRLTDHEARQLGEIVDNYEKYRGRSDVPHTRSFTDWSSEGKYTRTETTTDTFMEERVGIRSQYTYRDDDGQTGGHTTEITDGRGILNRLNNRP